jgi:hypothetical protein
MYLLHVLIRRAETRVNSISKIRSNKFDNNTNNIMVIILKSKTETETETKSE